MRVVHEPAGERGDEPSDESVAEPGDGAVASRVLATDVETADTFAEQAKGLMFRESVPADYALVFDFGEPPRWSIDRIAKLRTIHMLFVTVPLDVLWMIDGTVTKKKTVSPWTGLGVGQADVVMELPAGAADGVEQGDTVRVDDDETTED